MPSKHGNIFYFVLGCLVIFFGLFMYWPAQDIPLPKNAKKEGNVIHIDLSDGATNEAERKEASFAVPEKFKPRVSESGFAFYFKFPDGSPYSGNDFPLPPDQIRVVVRHHARLEASRSNYVLQHMQPKDGPLFATPWFVERKDGLEIYQYKINKTAIGTYFNFIAKDGSNILVDDSGDWSRDYEIDRQFRPHIELTYLVPKPIIRDSKHFIEYASAVDDSVLKLVQTFQSK